MFKRISSRAFRTTKNLSKPLKIALIVLVILGAIALMPAVLAALPQVDSILLTSIPPGNSTTADLILESTVSDPDADPVKKIINWYKDGSSLAVLNMPFEGGSSSTFTKDYSGYGNNGTVTNAVWRATGGHDGFGAYEFDGSGDYIGLGNNSSLEIDGDLTISFWLYWRGGTTYLLSKGSGNDNTQEFQPTILSNRPYFYIGNAAGDNASRYNSGYTLSTNTWYHLAFVIDGSIARIYVNGAEQGSGGTIPSRQNNSDPVRISGRSGGPSTYDLDGFIDEVAIYNKRLSPEQINALYQNRTDLIVSQETEDGEVWQASVTPNDGVGDGVEVYSNRVTIGVASTPDIIGPAITVDAVYPASKKSKDFIDLQFTVEDDTGILPSGVSVSGVTYNLGGNPSMCTVINSKKFQCEIFVTSSGDVTITASDTASPANTTIDTSQTGYIIDKIAPASSVLINGFPPSSGWYNSAVDVTLSATDAGGAGVKKIRYSTNGGSSYSDYSVPVHVAAEGITDFRYYAEDNAETGMTVSDPYTKLMLHMNGTGGGTTFTDSSPTTKTASAVGNANTSTAQYKWTSAAYLDGAGDAVSVDNHTDFYIDGGAFTIDLWYYNLGTNSALISKGYYTAGANGNWYLGVYAGNIYFNFGDGASYTQVFTSGAGVVANTWYHIALVREGTGTNQTKIYVNGALKGTGTVSNAKIGNNTYPIIVGRSTNGSAIDFRGYIDEVRFSNVARWTSAFTPPTVEYSPPPTYGNLETPANSLFIKIDTNLPTTPTLLHPTVGDYTSLGTASSPYTVNWSSPDTGPSLHHYKLYRKIDAGSFALYQDNLTTDYFSETGLLDGTKYTYKVVAVNSAGNESSDSNEGDITIDRIGPDRPSISGPVWSTGTAAITWGGVADNVGGIGIVDHYSLFRTSGGCTIGSCASEGPIVSGVDKTYYRIGETGDFSVYTGPVIVNTPGENTFYYYSTDKAGNMEDVKSLVIKIDADSDNDGVYNNYDNCPTVSAAYYQGCPSAIQVNAEDWTLTILDDKNRPKSTKGPLAGLPVKIYDYNLIKKDYSTCKDNWKEENDEGEEGDSEDCVKPNEYDAIVAKYIPLYTGTTDATGMVKIGVYANDKVTPPVKYIVIGDWEDALSYNKLHNKLVKKVHVHENKTKKVKMRLECVTGSTDKKCYSAKKTIVSGSGNLDIMEPEYIEYTDGQEYYPIIFQSSDNFIVEVSVMLPEGWIPDTTQIIRQIPVGTIDTVQFKLTPDSQALANSSEISISAVKGQKSKSGVGSTTINYGVIGHAKKEYKSSYNVGPKNILNKTKPENTPETFFELLQGGQFQERIEANKRVTQEVRNKNLSQRVKNFIRRVFD